MNNLDIIKTNLRETAESLKVVLKKEYAEREDAFNSPCIIFDCSFRYAKNRLLKSGKFIQCENPCYIQSTDNKKIYLHSYNQNRALYFDNSAIV